jgi:hypothetical protein
MPYTHFRFVAYEVPTATRKPHGPVESGFNAGAECQLPPGIQVSQALPKDARIRLKRLASVAFLAKSHVALLGDNANTLKIFMAPEFYFRPPVTEGSDYTYNSYPRSVYQLIINELGKMFRDAIFDDWLIIPGTAMMNAKIHPTSAQIVYFNSCFQIIGGAGAAASGNNLLYIEKKMPSNLDGVPYGPGNDQDARQVFETWAFRKKRVFTVNGVRLGLEICLDHGTQVLKRTLSDWSSNEGGINPQPLDLQLLTAGGMPVQTTSVAAKLNGYILRNDGYSNPPHSELRQITSYTGTNPWDLLGDAGLAPTIAVAQTVALTGAQVVPMKSGNIGNFTQNIVIYPALLL